MGIAATALPLAGELDSRDAALLGALENGLPLVARPYAAVGALLDMPEAEVLARLARLREVQVIKRWGVVVRHRELGYRANGMVVWDVPDHRVATLGRRLSHFPCVTLCYRRPRRPPDWNYNLFTMIHGRDEAGVRANLGHLVASCRLEGVTHEVLFSERRFKQRGARYLGGYAGTAGRAVVPS
ncbi:MAG: AsnC family protein [Gammaproteobacteria bacterium]|nr:AsnC family protein [Gammaproteobacteria bacterium]